MRDLFHLIDFCIILNMKNLFILTSILFCAAFLAACSCGKQKALPVNGVPQTLARAAAKADKKCQADSDCAAVQKGCCMCAGYEAVNAKAAEKINAVRAEECAAAACTMEMCYVEIIPVCQNNVCTGKPKPYEAYFAK